MTNQETLKYNKRHKNEQGLMNKDPIKGNVDTRGNIILQYVGLVQGNGVHYLVLIPSLKGEENGKRYKGY